MAEKGTVELVPLPGLAWTRPWLTAAAFYSRQSLFGRKVREQKGHVPEVQRAPSVSQQSSGRDRKDRQMPASSFPSVPGIGTA